jgi:O-antigen ligase
VPPWLIAGGGVLAAMFTGAALVRDRTIGLSFLGACVFVPLVLLDLGLAFALWIPLGWNEYSHAFGKAPLGSSMLLLVAWIGTRERRPRGALASVPPSIRVVHAGFALLIVWVTLSVSWAANRTDAWHDAKQWWFAGLVFVLVTAVATTPARLRMVAVAFVVGALVSIAIGLSGRGLTTTANAFDLATRDRFSGGAGDPNYLAAGLVAAIALAAGLIASTRDSLARLAGAATVVGLAAAMAATGSRGGLIAALCAVLTAVVVARGHRAATATFAVFAVAAVTFFLLMSPAGLKRITEADAGGTGRSDLWHVAVEMAADHPIVGVGINNFKHESRHYVLRPGSLSTVANFVDRPEETHNIYLQQLAETGIVGLLALVVVCLACLTASQTAAARFRARGDPATAALACATTVAIVGMLAASAFISNGPDKRLWIVLALGPALLTAAESPQPASTDR